MTPDETVAPTKGKAVDYPLAANSRKAIANGQGWWGTATAVHVHNGESQAVGHYNRVWPEGQLLVGELPHCVLIWIRSWLIHVFGPPR